MSLPIRIIAEVPDRASHLDVLLHAAAQLPQDVTFEVPATGAQRERLQTLALAYGIESRISFKPAQGAPPNSLSVRLVLPLNESDPGLGGPSLNWDLYSRPNSADPIQTLSEFVEALNSIEGNSAETQRGSDEIFRGQRVALVTNIPNHYRVPLWNLVGNRLRAAGGEFRVLFTSADPHGRKPWMRYPEVEFDHRVLRTRKLATLDVPVGLIRELREFDPSTVMSAGFAPPVTGRVLRFARRRRIPFGLWSGDTYRQAKAKQPLRRVERQWIARRSDYAISLGWLSAEYIRSLAPGLPVVIGRNTTPFVEDAPRQLEPPVEVLAVSRAVPGKRLDVIVDAFRLLEGEPCRLTVAGGGPELDALRVRARGDPRIRFMGTVPTDEILKCYASAEIFVFPSVDDIFGLVLVEAMGSGLATITATEPAGVADLAVHERNCLIVEGRDPAVWADAIRRLVVDTDLRRTLGLNARNTIIRRWTMAHAADAWVAAFRLGLLQARSAAMGSTNPV